jgi:hypothetical protein
MYTTDDINSFGNKINIKKQTLIDARKDVSSEVNTENSGIK